ncbi:nuclear transport factor 2 family protein [Tsukamurella sp. 8F]|uniref:nuclear transport factor 2 family protein n=1 Tax=unclassified Tsukamurella TaxID=2633480 RepID=UPI0023B92147|nr:MULTISPECIES: nuclear transport factor 2 family protein [unclassified Tsukamurella]MDF0528877.1 nuclear transport factor 2 family protein [Tsukamurella sp. 8J]MDF0586712.1 nuclear transport factor 2 family protein [Tsukamurella sp. 8F]
MDDHSRPALDLPDSESGTAVERLVAALQSGFDTGDADRYDSMFASDVLWGTPKGHWLAGYANLNPIHRGMMGGTPVKPASRFEPVQVIRPAPGLVVAQIRRAALNGGFSEVAMYVMVLRDGDWWLAAAQNTPVSGVLPPIGPE